MNNDKPACGAYRLFCFLKDKKAAVLNALLAWR
jgi:hypothetical protein